MTRARYRGAVSRRVRNTPLVIQHLDRALSETTSRLERDLVYSKLSDMTEEARRHFNEGDSESQGFVEFYAATDRMEAPLSIPENYDGMPDPKKVRKGKDQAKRLREGVILPRLGHERYDSRMLQAKHNEYEILTGETE